MAELVKVHQEVRNIIKWILLPKLKVYIVQVYDVGASPSAGANVAHSNSKKLVGVSAVRKLVGKWVDSH